MLSINLNIGDVILKDGWDVDLSHVISVLYPTAYLPVYIYVSMFNEVIVKGLDTV
jgi:hypothetical protein